MQELKFPIKTLPKGWKTVLLYEYIKNVPLHCYVIDSGGSIVRVEFDESTDFDAHTFWSEAKIAEAVKRWEESNKPYAKSTIAGIKRDYDPVNYLNYLVSNKKKYDKILKGFVTDVKYYNDDYGVKKQYLPQIARNLEACTNKEKNRLAKSIVGKSVYDFMMSVDKVDCDIVSDNGDYTYSSLVDFGRNTLTAEGHAKWDAILKSYTIKKVWYQNGSYLMIFATGRDNGKQLDAFENSLAGYCSDTLWEKWFGDENKMSGFKTRTPKKTVKHNVKKCTKKYAYLENSVRRMF